MAEATNRVTISVHVEGQQAVRALGKVEKEFGDISRAARKSAKNIGVMGRSLRGITRQLKGFLLIAAAAFGVREIGEYASALVSASVAFKTLSGSAETAEKAMAAVGEVSAKSSTAFRTLAEQARFLFAVGFRDISELAGILRVVDDLAAGLGANFQQISFALAQIKAIGFLRGEEARQLLNANIGIEAALARQSEQLFGQKFTLGEIRKLIETRRISAEATIEAVRLFSIEQNVTGVSEQLLKENPTIALKKLLDDMLRVLAEFVLEFKGEMGSIIDVMRGMVNESEPILGRVADQLKDWLFLLGQVKDGFANLFSGDGFIAGAASVVADAYNLLGYLDPKTYILMFRERFVSGQRQASEAEQARIAEAMALPNYGPYQPFVGPQAPSKQFEMLEAQRKAAEKAAKESQFTFETPGFNLDILRIRMQQTAAEELVRQEKLRADELRKERDILREIQGIQSDSRRIAELGAADRISAERIETVAGDAEKILQIQIDAIKRRSVIEAEALDRRYELELQVLKQMLEDGLVLRKEFALKAAQFGEKREQDLMSRQIQDAKAIADLQRAHRDQIRNSEEQAWTQSMNAARSAGERLFDALITGTNNWGRVLRSTILSSFLTPLRQLAGNLSASLFGPVTGAMTGIGGAPVTGRTPGFNPAATGIGGVVPALGGLGGSYLGILKQLGGLGMGKEILAGGIPTGMFPDSGIGGALGGAMLAGGGALAAAGLVRGGLLGIGMTAGGGALIGAKFGGPLGAAIGAGIGAGAGIIRNLFKSPEDRIIKQVRELYGMTIDKQFATQLWAVISNQYGGNLTIGLQSPEVTDLLQAYNLQSGAGAGVIGNRPQAVSLYRAGSALGQITTPATLSAYQLNPGLGGGVNIIMPNAVAAWEGATMKLSSENPQVTAAANANASNASAGRLSNYALQAQPGLLT